MTKIELLFFANSPLPKNSEIVRPDGELDDYSNVSVAYVSKGFTWTSRNKTFDFISIGALDMKDYFRIDVLLMMPKNLARDFVIMIDDTNRKPEKTQLLQ